MMLLAPVPALAIGAVVMQRSGTATALWIQNVAAGLTLMVLAAATGAVPPKAVRSGVRMWKVAAVLALLLMAATLTRPGVDGVRRWVSVGPLHLHAAFVAIPILLVACGRIVRSDPSEWTSRLVACALVLAAVVLLAQPDPSQATAFASAAAILLWSRRRRSMIGWAAAGVVVLLAAVTWTRPDPLAPVPYVEGILGLASNEGSIWLVLSLLALAMLPMPFLAAARRETQRREGLALAVYFGIACIMAFTGAYPVPLLGYGLSPILGYFLALACVMLKEPANQAL
jgi:Cell cycle protein